MTGTRSIRGEQCRAGRGVLGWSLEALAYKSGIGRDAIGHFERGERATKPETLAAIIGALEAAGVEFTEDGVKRKRS
jgi:transcriptional regulator with XRE-family HTH domain